MKSLLLAMTLTVILGSPTQADEPDAADSGAPG